MVNEKRRAGELERTAIGTYLFVTVLSERQHLLITASNKEAGKSSFDVLHAGAVMQTERHIRVPREKTGFLHMIKCYKRRSCFGWHKDRIRLGGPFFVSARYCTSPYGHRTI